MTFCIEKQQKQESQKSYLRELFIATKTRRHEEFLIFSFEF